MTKNANKRVVITVLGVILIVIVGGVGIFFAKWMIYGTSVERLKNEYKKEIPTVTCAIDTDGDGIDDQMDFFQGTLDYIETKPKYKSKYYNTGYSDDGYGVCTDVIANAALAAGYDLMELLQEDIVANPKAYDIQEPDANIDFRRVKNLKVYFNHTATSLTTDVSAIEEWQGGDIVIFENHIGVVSDRRNKNGVPYVIHHNDPFQASYEEDILESRNDIVGHYRIGNTNN